MDRDLDAILRTTYDKEFEELWNRLIATRPTTPVSELTKATTDTANEGPPPPRATTTTTTTTAVMTTASARIETPSTYPHTTSVSYDIITSEGPPPRTTAKAVRRIPKVGTVIQRSTAANTRKLQALMQTPPPPPRRRHRAPSSQSNRPEPRQQTRRDTLTELFGSTLSDLSDEDRPADTSTTIEDREPFNPPPINVRINDEVTLAIPFYAVHVSRRYKARLGNKRFLLRFDRNGRCRFHREM